MKELWLARDDIRVIFDTKESKELLGCPRFSDDVSIFLTDKEYESYTETIANFHKWQALLEVLINSTGGIEDTSTIIK